MTDASAMVPPQGTGLKSWLGGASTPWFVLYATAAAFMTYFCMYAFRKPLAVGTFVGVEGWGFELDFKTVVMIAQISGYAASKWIGVKVISEMTRDKRAWTILGLVVSAEIALILFAILPAPLNIIALFFNGLPLGMIWGLVFSYLEGRRTSEILGVGLCTSFILSSGVVKSVGKYLMLDWQVSEFWMPAVTGGLFLPLLCLSVYFLSKIPPPNRGDVRARTERKPMDGAARKKFLLHYLPGLVVLVMAYVILTAFRDFRDIFAAEIWIELGFGDAPEMFTISEAPTALLVLLVLGATMVLKNNLQAFKIYHGIIVGGAVLLALATAAFQAGMIGAVLWMMLVSLGLYLAYVPFNCMLFDRLMAVTKKPGNAGFMIYVADASGYLGSFSLLIFKSLAAPQLAWREFLEIFAYVTAGSAVVLLGFSLFYFSKFFDRQDLFVSSSQNPDKSDSMEAQHV